MKVIESMKYTFLKRCECGKEVSFTVDGIPDNLVVTSMSKEYSIKQQEPEQKIKQDQLSKGLDQQTKAEDADQSIYNLGNKNAKGKHHIKGKLPMH